MFRLSMVRWSQSTWWTCGQGTTPATLASGGSSTLAVICSISFCSSDDDDKLDKPITEAMDELCGEAPLEKPVVNGINTRFALCSSMSDQQLHRHRRWDRRAAPDLSASNCPEDNAKAQGYPARKLCSVQCQQCKCQHQSERFSFEAGLHGSELRVVSQEIPRIFAWKSETLVSL
ncbi:uncharacterized protein [Lolium perenne]|uniref:uncharacterized protein isoform X1 n=2 Tax=Lolium perenne TaxID=4522 RepID=UPI0021F5883A|nr:uncharacterized protein LOC127326936 isoform X4 [Lolium perenne]